MAASKRKPSIPREVRSLRYAARILRTGSVSVARLSTPIESTAYMPVRSLTLQALRARISEHWFGCCSQSPSRRCWCHRCRCRSSGSYWQSKGQRGIQTLRNLPGLNVKATCVHPSAEIWKLTATNTITQAPKPSSAHVVQDCVRNDQDTRIVTRTNHRRILIARSQLVIDDV